MKIRIRPSRVHLPKRSRPSALLATFDEVKSNLGLVASIADRVGSLPGIRCQEVSSSGEAALRRYFLDSAFLREPIAAESVQFAVLHPDGRLVLRVPRPELEEILVSGWGELYGERVRTFAPRDVGDLTVLWRIILMAYFDVVERRDSGAWQAIRPRSQNLRAAETGSRRIAPGDFF